MDPEEYFKVLEPSRRRRQKIIETCRYIVEPRTDPKSIVIVQGPPSSGRTSLIKLLQILLPQQTVEIDKSDVCRVWRAFEMKKVYYPLRFVILSNHQDIVFEDLPMITNNHQPVEIDEEPRAPTFRYLIKRDQSPLDIPDYIKDRVVVIELRQTLHTHKLAINVNRFIEYLKMN